jgi:homoserine dehydrogenase
MFKKLKQQYDLDIKVLEATIQDYENQIMTRQYEIELEKNKVVITASKEADSKASRTNSNKAKQPGVGLTFSLKYSNDDLQLKDKSLGSS